MELIPINDFKLKIMLDESDMKELNICDEADCANNETRHAIRTILDRAKEQIGFNTEGSEIFVQLYTSRSGGCELFVTKSNISNKLSSYTDKKSDKKSAKRDTLSKKNADDECRALSPRGGEALPKPMRKELCRMIFSFDSLGDLCKVCKILEKMPHKLSSRAYCGSNNDYYLILDNTEMSAYSRLDKLTFILEYGKRERADHIHTYLCEHGKTICSENAISTLAVF